MSRSVKRYLAYLFEQQPTQVIKFAFVEFCKEFFFEYNEENFKKKKKPTQALFHILCR